MYTFLPGVHATDLVQDLVYGLDPSCESHDLWGNAGTRYGPPGTKRLIYFADDCNMPLVDKYDTQSAIELIRQAVDYQGWFDKVISCDNSGYTQA